MAKNKRNECRHRGIRYDMWFPVEEHEAVVETMEILKIENKSEFVRSAVKSFINEIRELKGINK